VVDVPDLIGPQILIQLQLYQYYVELLMQSGLKVGMGKFAADMKVELINDGPVTFFLER